VSRVELRGWGWRYPGRKAWAVRDLDLTVESGERVLLLGVSGAGKSTLLRGLAGALDPYTGEECGSLLVDGRHPRSLRRGIGYLQQDPESQLVMARSGDDVAFGLENTAVPADEIWPRVDAALSTVDFPYDRAHPTSALSGGEQQRLALAGVFAMRPRLLLLDEPTANLDPAGAAAVRHAIAAIHTATLTTTILVEHRVDAVLPLVDRVVVLGNEGIVADGAPDAVFAQHGRMLAAAGVWVPGHRSAMYRSSLPPADRTSLLDAAHIHVDRGPKLPSTSLSVASGEALAITGPNGAGKTTIARVLGGLLRPSGGSVVVGPGLAPPSDKPPWRWRARDLAARIGSVFQDPEHQFLTGAVRDELLLRTSGAQSRVDDLLERLRLAPLARANPFTLSGGEQRRLSVATALVNAPKVLILDEPTFGQDLRTWSELVELLAGIRAEGTGLVVVTHDVDFVGALADREIVLGNPSRMIRDDMSAAS
jgi:energy-coupling factor transporter ATP-binding protein EcfA2